MQNILKQLQAAPAGGGSDGSDIREVKEETQLINGSAGRDMKVSELTGWLDEAFSGSCGRGLGQCGTSYWEMIRKGSAPCFSGPRPDRSKRLRKPVAGRGRHDRHPPSYDFFRH